MTLKKAEMRAVDLESQLRQNILVAAIRSSSCEQLPRFHEALLLEPPSGTVILFIVMCSTEVLTSDRKGSLVI